MLGAFLVLNGIVWLGYGAYLLFDPAALAEIANVEGSTAGGLVELRAMYGGLQSAIGILSLVAARSATMARPYLLGLAVLVAGLAVGRVSGMALEPAGADGYNLGAAAFEVVTALVAARLSASA